MAGPVAFLAPDPIQSTQLIPGGNTPASGGLLFCYNVGTTNKQNTYTDPSASTARTNPIVLDSGGNIPGNGEVWITSTCKFVLAPSNDQDPPQSPYWTRDNYYGINNITAAQVQSLSAQNEWVTGSSATFVGVTAFTVSGDQTALYTLGRRIKATVTGGDRFGVVTSQTLATGSTTVGVTLDSGTLNAGLSALFYGILSTPNGSVPWTQLTTTGISVYSPISAQNFVPNNTTAPLVGLYQPGTLTGGLSANSTKALDWTSSAVNAYLPVNCSGNAVKGAASFANSTSYPTSLTLGQLTLVNGRFYSSNGTSWLPITVPFYFDSGEQTVTFSSTFSVSHGLTDGAGNPRKPNEVSVILRCKTIDASFAVDDEIPYYSTINAGNVPANPVGANTTKIFVGAMNAIPVVNKSTAAIALISATNWVFVVRAS
jgi:hypothetical protein